MKNYTLKSNLSNDDGKIFFDIDEIQGVLEDSEIGNAARYHTYPAPYERNDRYILLRDEMDSKTKDNELEPPSGHLLYADLDFEYNYYAKEYENGSRRIKSEYLPDLNVWLLVDQQDADGDGEPNYFIPDSYMDRHEAMFRLYQKNVGPMSTSYTWENEASLSKEYFELYTNSYDTVSELAHSLPLDTRYGVTEHPEFINKTMSEIYSDKLNKRENFPFYVKFKMTGVSKSGFCDILEETSLEQEFIDFLVMHRDQHMNTDRLYTRRLKEKETSIQADVALYSFQGFMNHLENNHGSATISGANHGDTDCEFFESFLSSIVVQGKVNNFIKTSTNQHIFPVAFRMEKTVGDGPSSRIVSVKYFFNYSDMLEYRLYDSQVGYGMTCTYNIKVINGLVKPIRQNSDQELVFVDEILFLEEPYYEEDVKVLDSPPVAPDIELLTYRGIDNKVLILFNQMIDQRLEVPIIINESDFNGNIGDFTAYDTDTTELGVQFGIEEVNAQIYGFHAQYLAQGIPMFDENGEYNPIFFESDDPTDFELFKCTKHPVSYDDFRNEHYRFISSGNPRKLTAASYEDTIVPNQPYYYMFRSQDVHGNVSNPSPIYEFILNKEGETLYPRIRIVDFAKPEPPIQKDKTFKKYLKIGFSPRQYQIPSDHVQNINDDLISGDIPIGITDDNLIGSDRTFKFRIRSKNTGKLLDINVTFKKNNVIKA